MKVISLNAYSGVVFLPLMKFIEEHADSTDIFCFQEVTGGKDQEQAPGDPHTNLFAELQKRLPDHAGQFEVMEDEFAVDKKKHCYGPFGLSIFVRKGIDVKSRDAFFICNHHNSFDGKDYSTLGHAAMSVTVDIDGTDVTICTLHGVAFPAHKLDTDTRIAQSQKIIDEMAGKSGEKIVMGDFNLLPEAESIKMFEVAGYRDLVKGYEIQTTRGSHMRVLFPEYEHGEYGFQEFADYTFVTPGIDVQSFEVPDEPISDHLPMILEFE